VPVDRPAILRNAEKLLRSGKLDQAIAEYLRIVMELQADAGNYRDVAARIDRLATVRARG
jgi:hypothetical protein